MIRHILFDLDHTLWDFDGNSLDAMHELYRHFDLAECFASFDDFHTRYLRHNAELWRLYAAGEVDKATVTHGRFFRTLSEVTTPTAELTAAMGQYYLDATSLRTGLMPNALTTLSTLRDKGYCLSIITNGFREVQYKKISRSGLRPYISGVFISDEVGAMKPSPLFFGRVLEKLGATAAECIVVGDNLHSDILGAQDCGIRAVYYNSRHENFHYLGEQIYDLSELADRVEEEPIDD